MSDFSNPPSEQEIQDTVDNSQTASDVASTESTVSTNLDAKVSNAGKTATDKNSTSEIATGVDNSTTASTVSANLDAPVSGAGATQTDIETAVDNSTTASTVSTNLDAPVSGAGATQTDIETGAEKALEEDIANLSPASNSVAANLDGGVSVSAVDWASKTPNTAYGSGTTSFLSTSTTVSVSGSGYLFNARATIDDGEGFLSNRFLIIEVDGTELVRRSAKTDFETAPHLRLDTVDTSLRTVEIEGIIRFESSVKIKAEDTEGDSFTTTGEIQNVFD